MFIGQRIKKCRELRGYSQAYLASELKIQQAAMSKLESSKDISFSKLEQIAEILDLTIEDIICFNDKMVFSIMNKKTSGLVVSQESQTEKKLYDQYIETLKEEIAHLKSVIDKLLKNQPMKPTKTKIVTLLFCLSSVFGISQTKNVATTKSFTDVIKNIDCGNEDCSIVMATTPETSLKLLYEADGKTLKLNDFGKLVIRTMSNGTLALNPEFRDKAVKVTCSFKHVKGKDENGEYAYDEYSVEKIEVEQEKDNFKTATCKAYDYTGRLIYIVENNIIYIIRKGQKADNKTIQNNDELCVRGNECIKIKSDASCINIYKLPNTTDKTGSLKIIGNKIYRTQKGTCEADTQKEYLEFTGNKTQIALIAVVYRLGMGH